MGYMAICIMKTSCSPVALAGDRSVGLVGEVGFGAANMFYDPADRDDLCLDPRRIAQMADAFSRALDVDPRRLLDQAYAYGCLSAAWNADGEEEQRDLAIAAAIKQVRQTSY